MHNSLLHLLLKNCNFLNIDISQGSVVTRLGCGGVFKYDFVTNFLLNLTVKEFGKSVNLWQSYRQEYSVSVLFFYDSRCINNQSSDITCYECALMKSQFETSIASYLLHILSSEN